jgi:hypothetical protein
VCRTSTSWRGTFSSLVTTITPLEMVGQTEYKCSCNFKAMMVFLSIVDNPCVNDVLLSVRTRSYTTIFVQNSHVHSKLFTAYYRCFLGPVDATKSPVWMKKFRLNHFNQQLHRLKLIREVSSLSTTCSPLFQYTVSIAFLLRSMCSIDDDATNTQFEHEYNN